MNYVWPWDAVPRDHPPFPKHLSTRDHAPPQRADLRLVHACAIQDSPADLPRVHYATQNGGLAHACDLRQQMLAAMAETHCFQCDERAPLPLIKPAEKDIHVMMKGLIRMRVA
jgi:hypothetical protein